MLPLLSSMAILASLLFLSIFTSSLSAPTVVHAVACAAFQSQIVFGVSSSCCCHPRAKENPPPSAKAALLREAQVSQAGGTLLFIYSKQEVGAKDPTLYMFKIRIWYSRKTCNWFLKGTTCFQATGIPYQGCAGYHRAPLERGSVPSLGSAKAKALALPQCKARML